MSEPDAQCFSMCSCKCVLHISFSKSRKRSFPAHSLYKIHWRKNFRFGIHSKGSFTVASVDFSEVLGNENMNTGLYP